MNINELKELRSEKISELENLIASKNEREDKSYTDEEAQRFDSLEGEVNDLDIKIERAEKEEKIAKRKAVKVEKKTEERKVAENFSFSEAARQAQSGNLTGLYAELDQEGRSNAVSAGVTPNAGGIVLPEFAIRAENTATEGTQPADGGNLIPKDRRGFIEALYDRTIMGQAGIQMLNGLSGNVEMPSEDSVVSASWAGETSAVPTQKATFGMENMSPVRLAAAVAYSTQLLRQSSPSIDAVMRRQIDQAIAQKLDDTFINGYSAGNVDGLVDATGTLASSDFNYDMLLEILQKGEEANLDATVVVSSPKARVKFMKEYTNTNGNGLPLLTGDSLITGSRFLSSNKVSNAEGGGTNETQLFAFDPNQFYAGAWGGIQLTVDNLTMADSAKVKLVVNSFWDMLLIRKDKAYKASVAI